MAGQALYNLDLPELLEENFPEQVRDSLFNPHFTHEKGEQVVFRLDPKAVLALDSVAQWPNIPDFMQTRSGVLRYCIWVGLSLFASSVGKPNSKLTSIMAVEAMEARAKTRKLINQSLKAAILAASEDVAELVHSPNSEGEQKRIIEELMGYIHSLDGDFWTDKWMAEVLNDKTLSKVIRELKLGGLIGNVREIV